MERSYGGCSFTEGLNDGCFNSAWFIWSALKVPCVSIHPGNVEHEQAAKTSTDSKDHDGVWETGLNKIPLSL